METIYSIGGLLDKPQRFSELELKLTTTEEKVTYAIMVANQRIKEWEDEIKSESNIDYAIAYAEHFGFKDKWGKELVYKYFKEGYINTALNTISKFNLSIDINELGTSQNFKSIEDYRGYAELLIKQGKDIKDIPEYVIKEISRDQDTSYFFIEFLVKQGKDIKEIPYILIESIARDLKLSYSFVELFIKQVKDIKEIPKIIMQNITQNPYYYAMLLIEQGKDIKEIPRNIIEDIIQDPNHSYNFAKLFIKKEKNIKKIPYVIIESISRSLSLSYDFANLLIGKGKPVNEIPEIIMENIVRDPRLACIIICLS